MPEAINITTHEGNISRILVGNALEQLDTCLPPRRVIAVTDSNIHRRYRELVERFEHIIIGIGETNKTLITADRVYRELMAMHADRDCFLLGIGGGIVTDITGFCASTYMRGLPFGFISTTLLGQVDASIGGKNGVNVDGYKNMVGTFSQPKFVICDTAMLSTLPEREFRAGLAEVLKAGIIADPELFSLITGNPVEKLRTDNGLLTRIITRAIRVKAAIVESDEREAGLRRLLNLGHTVAHAIESISDLYQHGEAVAVGTCMAADAAVRMGILACDEARQIRSAFDHCGLPTSVGIERSRLLKALRNDKKSHGDEIYFVVPTAIGSCRTEKIPFTDLETLL